MARNPSSQRADSDTSNASGDDAANATAVADTSGAQTATATAPAESTAAVAATQAGTAGVAPAAAAGTTGAATATTNGTDARKKIVNDPTAVPPYSQKIARADLIRKLWATGQYNRSQITAVLNDPNVNPDRDQANNVVKVPYQIVFAATKGQPGGPAQTAPSTIAPSPTPAAAQPAATPVEQPTVAGEGQATG